MLTLDSFENSPIFSMGFPPDLSVFELDIIVVPATMVESREIFLPVAAAAYPMAADDTIGIAVFLSDHTPHACVLFGSVIDVRVYTRL